MTSQAMTSQGWDAVDTSATPYGVGGESGEEAADEASAAAGRLSAWEGAEEWEDEVRTDQDERDDALAGAVAAEADHTTTLEEHPEAAMAPEDPEVLQHEPAPDGGGGTVDPSTLVRVRPATVVPAAAAVTDVRPAPVVVRDDGAILADWAAEAAAQEPVVNGGPADTSADTDVETVDGTPAPTVRWRSTATGMPVSPEGRMEDPAGGSSVLGAAEDAGEGSPAATAPHPSGDSSWSERGEDADGETAAEEAEAAAERTEEPVSEETNTEEAETEAAAERPVKRSRGRAAGEESSSRRKGPEVQQMLFDPSTLAASRAERRKDPLRPRLSLAPRLVKTIAGLLGLAAVATVAGMVLGAPNLDVLAQAGVRLEPALVAAAAALSAVGAVGSVVAAGRGNAPAFLALTVAALAAAAAGSSVAVPPLVVALLLSRAKRAREWLI